MKGNIAALPRLPTQFHVVSLSLSLTLPWVVSHPFLVEQVADADDSFLCFAAVGTWVCYWRGDTIQRGSTQNTPFDVECIINLEERLCIRRRMHNQLEEGLCI